MWTLNKWMPGPDIGDLIKFVGDDQKAAEW